MSTPEVSLRLRSQAELQALREYGAGVRQVRVEITDLTAAFKEYQVVTRGQTGAAAPGPAPPGPPMPPPGPPGAGAPAAPGPAPPGPPMPPPGPPGAGAPGAAGGPSGPGGAMVSASGVMVSGRGAMGSAGQFISNAASTAIGVGLGSSLTGFILGSGQTYMELSRVITHLGRRFREAGQDVAFFGQRLGFTVAETSSFVETLGEQTNRVSRGQVQRMLGFARERGLDPGVAMSSLGILQRLSGQAITDRVLAEMVGRAGMADMGQGRFGEYVRATTSLAEAGFGATGRADLPATLALQALPGIVFGPTDPRAQGQTAVDFLGRLSSVVSGGTNPAMRTFMMRAMGYGRPGGPGYIEMRKRLDAGVFGEAGAANLFDLFDAMRLRGMGRGAQFRALESVAGGSLKAHELEAIVGSLGTAEGLERFNAALYGGEGRQTFLAELSGQERATFEKLGFAGLGTMPGRVSMGEAAGVQLEAMKMAVGAPVAQGMLDIRDTLVNIAAMIGNLAGVDLGTLLTDLTGAVKDLSEFMRRFGTREGLSDSLEFIAPELGLTTPEYSARRGLGPSGMVTALGRQ